MKRKFSVIMCCILCCFTMTACGGKGSNTDEYFVVEREWDDAKNANIHYSIVHAKDTGVRYCIMKSRSGVGITPLYNTDGSVQISDKWKEKKE